MTITLCLLGLDDAGLALAADLLEAGADVYAYDAGTARTPAGIRRAPHPSLAVAHADVVLSMVPADQSKLALMQSIDALRSDAVYADCSTASPLAKRELADFAARREVRFADVVALESIAAVGLAAPLQAVGNGAKPFAERFASLGVQVQTLDAPVGSVAIRRQLREVALSAMAAVANEVVQAAAATDSSDWLLEQLSGEFALADSEWLRALVNTTSVEVQRRQRDASELASIMQRLGLASTMTSAASESLALSPPERITAAVPFAGEPDGLALEFPAFDALVREFPLGDAAEDVHSAAQSATEVSDSDDILPEFIGPDFEYDFAPSTELSDLDPDLDPDLDLDVGQSNGESAVPEPPESPS